VSGFSEPLAICRIVCGMSPFQTSSFVTPPAGMPGPRISSGTRDAGSYGRYLPLTIRCSPRKKPLSEAKMM
jgi:hypothetical protein